MKPQPLGSSSRHAEEDVHNSSQVSSSSFASSSSSSSFLHRTPPGRSRLYRGTIAQRRRESLDSVASCSSFNSSGYVEGDSLGLDSPPMRWPSARTPRRRKTIDGGRPPPLFPPLPTGSPVAKIEDDDSEDVVMPRRKMNTSYHDADDSIVSGGPNDSGYFEGIFASPPINKSILAPSTSSPLLRTPTDVLRRRTGNSFSSGSGGGNTPSPLRAFTISRVSAISPAAKLRTSNGNNATVMSFSGADIPRSGGPFQIGGAAPAPAASSSSSIPSTSSSSTSFPLPSRDVARRLRMATPRKNTPSPRKCPVDIVTPSKELDSEPNPFIFEDADLSSIRIPRLSSIPECASGHLESSSSFSFASRLFASPIKSEPRSEGEEEEDDTENDDESTRDSCVTAPPVPPPKVLASILSRPPLADIKPNVVAGRELKRPATTFDPIDGKRPKAMMINNSDPMLYSDGDVKPDVNALNAAIAPAPKAPSKALAVFRTPKKPFKAYSKRWWQIVTGASVDQRSLTAQAHAFLKKFNPTSSSAVASPYVYDAGNSMDSFAAYSGSSSQDPLFYQPPPISTPYPWNTVA